MKGNELTDDYTCCKSLNLHITYGVYFSIARVGPRMCIGYRFAMEEAKLVLIRIYRQLTFELVKEKLPSSGQLELQMGVVLKPKDGMWVIPKNRPQYSDKSPLTF